VNALANALEKFVQNEYASRAPAPWRTHAWERFMSLGLPSARDEEWKYTQLRGLERVDWRGEGGGVAASGDRRADAVRADEVASTLKQKLKLSDWEAHFDLVYVVNGQPVGDWASPLESWESSSSSDGFVHLATALGAGGYHLHVRKTPARPLMIVSYCSGPDRWVSSLRRVTLESGVELELAELNMGDSGVRYMRSELTQVELRSGSRLTWLREQAESSEAMHFADISARVEANAYLHMAQIQAGAHWQRTTVKADIVGSGGEVQLQGMTFGRKQQHMDQRISVHHLAADTQSSQLFKSVLRDSARGVMNGKIHIARDAQRVSSRQLNQNLLLSSLAEADTVPQLEVYADDVKANHGASVGRLDEDKLFYLLSRGISRPEATQMMAEAFVTDVVMRIPSGVLRRVAEVGVARWAEALP